MREPGRGFAVPPYGFVSFTLSQVGMVRHWNRKLAGGSIRPRRAIRRAQAVNAVDAVATVRFVVLDSPYRELTEPVVTYVTEHHGHPHDTVTGFIPEYVPGHWWEQVLHNQGAVRIKASLLHHPGVVVTDVPYRLVPRGRQSARSHAGRRSAGT